MPTDKDICSRITDEVERVARALCAREANIFGYDSDNAAELWRRNRSRYLKEARVALESPTKKA